MNIRKVIEKRIREKRGGVDLAADVHAVIAANVGERGQTTSVSSRQTAVAGSHAESEDDPQRDRRADPS